MKRGWLLALLLLALLTGCGGRAQEPKPTPTPVIIEQWAVTAEASSEYGKPDWSVRRLLGPPDVEGCADDPHAWSSARGNGLESVDLHYAQPVRPTRIRIYQNFGRGAVARVYLLDEAGEAHLVWQGTDEGECPGVLTIEVPGVDYLASGVRVELDESRTGFWNEIDAVALIGAKP